MEEPQVINGRYRVERLIGEGGIGEVHYGVDLQTNEPVAIKALKPRVVEQDPKILERFRREGEALKALNHPNIVKMLATVEEEGQHYIVMEYVSGGSLRDLLKEEGKLPIERVLYIALDLCDALTRAHRLKIIHRDIKPGNILLAPDGTPRLTDFGAARHQQRHDLTQEGGVVGTVSYLSPEACRGEPIDGRADIWSFGILIYEMLTGTRPFDKHETLATVIAIVKNPLPDLLTSLPDAPPNLVNLIYQMLEKDPDQRIASMRLVGAELEAIIEQADTGVRQALDLIYRMLERDEPTPGMRILGAKLGMSMDRAASQVKIAAPRTQPINLEKFEKPAPPPVIAPAPLEATEGSSGLSREMVLIGGLVVIVVALAIALAIAML